MDLWLDASAFLGVILKEPERQQIVDATKGAEFVVPEILPYEIGNALIAMYKKKRLDKTQVQYYFNVFNVIPLHIVKVDVPKALAFSCAFNCYAYDAYYLEVAQKLRLPLLTLDSEMKNNAKQLHIKTIEL
jgi:predicted nucleic acid-binding protein